MSALVACYFDTKVIFVHMFDLLHTYIDELIRDVLLGELYTVIGIPVYQLCGASTSIDISIEANNTTHVPVPVADVAPCKLSATVQEIYDACSYSSWAFAATLAYSFAGTHDMICTCIYIVYVYMCISKKPYCKIQIKIVRGEWGNTCMKERDLANTILSLQQSHCQL